MKSKTVPDAAPKKIEKAAVSEWTLVGLLAAVNFTHILDFVIMMPLGPQLMRVFSLSPQQFSFVVSAYTFSAAISGLVSAIYLDRFSRRTALCTMYAGFLVGTFCCAMAPTFLLLVVARATAGIFGGVTGTLVHAIIGDAVPIERRGRATGTVMASFSLASVLGVPLGLDLALRFSWHAPFLAIAGAGVFVLALLRLRLPRFDGHVDPNAGRRALSDITAILRDGNHQRAFFMSASLMLAGFTVIPFISPYLVKNAGLPETKIPLIYLAGGMCTLFTSRIVGSFCDRLGHKKTLYWVGALSCVPILTLTNLPPLPVPLILLTTAVFMIFVSGRFVPMMSLVNSSANPRYRGGFLSVNNSVQSAASGVASLLSGFVLTEGAGGRLVGYNVVGYVSVAFTLAMLLLARRVHLRG